MQKQRAHEMSLFKPAFVLRILIFVGLVCLIGWQIYNHQDEIKVLQHINKVTFGALIVISFLYNLINAARFASIYQVLGIKMKIWESFGLCQVATLLNLIFPAQPGGMVRAIYLKHSYNLPYSQAPALLFGSVIFSFFIGGIIMLCGNFAAMLMKIPVPSIFWFISIGTSFCVSFFWINPPTHLFSRLGRIGNMLNVFLTGWKSFRKDKRLLVKICFYQILLFMSSGLAIWLAFYSLRLNINFLLGTVVMVSTSTLTLVYILPGNFVVQETLIAYFSELCGIVFAQGLIAAALVRLASMAVILIIAPIAWFFLFYQKDIGIKLLKNLGSKSK